VPVQNSEIAEIFYEIADLLEIEDANPFRVRAYRNAARTVAGYPRRINEMVEEGEDIDDLSGVGEDLAKKIREIVQTGNLEFLEKVRSRTPHSLIKLLGIKGLGPKRVQKLFNELGIRNLKELRAAIESGKVAHLEGFGNKTVENIRQSLEADTLEEERTRLDIAEQFVAPLVSYLEELATVEDVAVAGSYRRRLATVGDLDIIAISDAGAQVAKAFVSYDSVDEVVSQGATKTMVILRSGLQVDLRIVSKEHYGAALLYFTGSKAHNIHLRNLAVDQGFKINEYGVYKGEERIAGQNESEIYGLFNLPVIPPELREDQGEIQAAREDRLPELVQLEDIRGDLQMHTDQSDGNNNLEEMAAAAEELGYAYIGVTDHTAYIGVTQGLKASDVAEYLRKIDSFNESHTGIRVLKGLEVDILEDGTLDMGNDCLEQLDLVLVAIHSHFGLSEEKQTERVLKALDNPYVNILAHPTARHIGSREPAALDMARIMTAALERGCFLEVNASPERLDLRDQHIRLAKDIGLKLVISTDSHRASSLNNMKYGVYQARRGWADKSTILNTLPLDELLDHLNRV
jgi:DNA polymerase (family 10)